MATNPMPASMKTIDGVKKVSIAIGGMFVTDASVELAVCMWMNWMNQDDHILFLF